MLSLVQKFSEAVIGFDAFCLKKKFLVYNLVERNLKIKYRRSLLGFFWTILSPIALACIYYFVFKVILKTSREHYLSFILSGVLPWAFFAQSISESTDSIVGNQHLISKIPIPVHVFPYVVILTNFSTLTLALPVIVGSTLLDGATLGLQILWLPYFVACLLLMSYGIGAILAVLYVYLRDLKHAIGLVLQIWFYATPILYDPSMVPEKYQWIQSLNPVASTFAGLQGSLLSGDLHFVSLATTSLGWSVAILACLRITYLKLRVGLPEVL